MAQTIALTTHPFDTLNGHDFISLTTYRKSGQPVPTPVWFAREGDNLYVMTNPTSGKVKRIRNSPHVTLAPCTFGGKILGESIEGSAQILQTEGENEMANRALKRKYGWQKMLFELFAKLRGNSYHLFLVITPA
jgi:PPOX class probable F420-dependent enzyme